MLIVWFVFEPQQTGGAVVTTRNTGRSQERKSSTSDERKDEYALAPEIQQESNYIGILSFSDVPKAASHSIQKTPVKRCHFQKLTDQAQRVKLNLTKVLEGTIQKFVLKTLRSALRIQSTCFCGKNLSSSLFFCHF